jgi:threonine dehydrogenase-like Zn-dependent dehydrogenase
MRSLSSSSFGIETPGPVSAKGISTVDLADFALCISLYAEAIRLVSAGKIDVKQIVTSQFPLERAKEAVEVCCEGRTRASVAPKLNLLSIIPLACG